MARDSASDRCEPATIAAWFQDGFHRFLRPYLRRHFHAVAVEATSLPYAACDPDEPLLLYGNHPSWWDPLIAHHMNRQLFPDRQFRAPIDAVALRDYQVFAKLGFYGVQTESKSGIADFLKLSDRLLKHRDGECPNALWITPEGRFADPRDTSVALMPGLSHLCHRLDRGRVIPFALEYVFWDERLPLCLIRFGPPLSIAEHALWTKPQWNEALTDRLRCTQAGLAKLAIGRDSAPFKNLLRGKRGAGGMYDTMRRIKARLTGQPFKAAHGSQFE